MERPDVPLELLIDAVLDGRPLDWATTESSASSEDQRAQIRQFRTLATIAALQREPEATDTIPSTNPDVTPEMWGSLRLLERIGAGSFAEVYRAWDRRLDREVALKLLRHPTAGGPVDSGVVDEGRLLARVRHPHVVTVHGADVVNGQVGIWMELVPGRTLEACVREVGPFEWRDAAAIGATICRALDAVHAAGLVHRDINAKNVMREDDGRVVLMDFGAGQAPADDRPGLVGTPLYLAPEIFEGVAANRTTDIYNVGVLLYHLLTGAYPVVGGTLEEIRDAHRHARRVPLRDHRSDLPDDFVEVIERATRPNAAERFVSASAMGAALEASLTVANDHPTAGEKPVACEPAGRPTAGWLRWPPTRARVTLSVSVIVLAGLMTAVLYASVWRGRWSGRSADVMGVSAGDPVTPSASAAPITVPNQTEAVEARSAALHFQGRDWVLIAAFENRTGEAVLDGTLEYALERELSNSPFVNVAPRERIEDVLQLMRKSKDAKVDARLGHEICLRDNGIRALLTGRVEKVGPAYLLTAQIVNPLDGGAMISLTEEAAQPADLLRAVRRQALRVREALGEMMSTIHRSQVELEKVTTPSLHALQLYSQASAFMHGENWKHEPAEELLKQAVAEDPDFASAYILLAHAIHNQGRAREEFMPHAERAAALATRTSDVERHFILGSYHGLVADTAGREEAERELRKAIAAYEALMRIKPDHYWGVENLARALQGLLGDNDRATAAALARAAEIRGNDPALNQRVARGLLMTGDVDGGRRYLRRAQAVASMSDFARFMVGDLTARVALYDRDVGRAGSIADELAAALPGIKLHPPGFEGWIQLAMLYAHLGRFDDAQRALQNLQPPAREQWLGVILTLRSAADFPGAADLLRNLATERYRRDGISRNGGFGPVLSAATFVSLGMVDELNDLVAKVKDDHRQTPPELLEIDAHVAVAEGRIEDAVRLFQSAKGGKIRDPVALWRIAWPLARALRAAGNEAEAARVLETATANQWRFYAISGPTSLWISSRNRLADLYRSMGRAKEADAIDADLLKLLAVADADHPVLMRLKARQTARTSGH